MSTLRRTWVLCNMYNLERYTYDYTHTIDNLVIPNGKILQVDRFKYSWLIMRSDISGYPHLHTLADIDVAPRTIT